MCEIACQIVKHSPKHLALPLFLPLSLFFFFLTPFPLLLPPPFFLLFSSSPALSLFPSPLPFSPLSSPLPTSSPSHPAVFDTIEQYAPGFRDLVVGWETLTPPDLERIFGLTGGVKHSLIPRPHGNEAGYLTYPYRACQPKSRSMYSSFNNQVVKFNLNTNISQWDSKNILV